MNIYSLPALISFTLNFSLAFIVLMDAPKVRLNRWFSAFIFSFALWNISEILILNSKTEIGAFFWAQLLYRIIFLAPAFFVIIAYQYPKNFHPWTNKPLFYFLVFTFPVLALLLSFPDFKIAIETLNPQLNIFYYHIVFTHEFPFILLIFIMVVYFIWGNWVLIKKKERLRTIRLKRQTNFFISGINIVFLIFIVTQLLRPILQQVLSFYFFSSLVTFLIDAFFFIAVVQIKIFKPRKYLSAGLSYTLLSSFALAVYFLIVKSLSESLTQYFHINSYTISGLVIFVLILLIKPFEKKLNELFDRYLNRNIHQYRKNSLKLFKNLQRYMEPEKFFGYVEKFLKEHFNISDVLSFYMPDENATTYVQIKEDSDQQIEIPISCYLTRELIRRKTVVEFYELELHLMNKSIVEAFKKFHARLFIPLLFENKLLGFLVLARKRFNMDYSEDELEIFEIFSRNIASALQRDWIIRQMREHYRERFRLEKLAALGQLTAGIAHEIRNPLNTISASAETLLQAQISEQERQELKQYIIDEVNRLNGILTDFLNLSKIKAPEYVVVKLTEIKQFIFLNLHNLANEATKIQCYVEPEEATILTDPTMLKQILLNLGSNALAAIRSRSEQDNDFKLSDGQILCTMKLQNNHLEIVMADNGVGIPEDLKEKIFEPFFTTQEMGTGLGLSIVLHLTEALGGKIDLKSEFGHTEFRVLLPQKVGQNKEMHYARS